MDFVPNKQLSKREIDDVLQNPDRRHKDDPVIDPVLLTAGDLYKSLWTLSCAAIVLAREHLESQPNTEVLLRIFQNSGIKYVGMAILAFGVDLDTIENLTPEASQRVVQMLFEKIINAVNEDLLHSHFSID
ncbi:MAG: hypothetical protein WC819_04275 [Parcubacteria group bacterium]|jgi:hypothetical protein